MNILFFGLPQAALALLDDGQCVLHAAICRKDAEGLPELRQRLGSHRVSVLPDVSEAWVREVAPEGVDLLVSWFWTKRLEPAVLRVAKLGSVGVHPSLLPRHRGPDPVFHAIDAGDSITGVSAHMLAAEYDVGDVYAHRTLDIDSDWDGWTLAQALDVPSLALLRELCGRFASGDTPVARPQDERLATRADTLSDEELELDPAWTTERTLRRVRAAAPWPGAWVWAGDEVLSLARASDAGRGFPGVTPGTVVVWGNNIYWTTLDGAICVHSARVGEDDAPREGVELFAAVRALVQA